MITVRRLARSSTAQSGIAAILSEDDHAALCREFSSRRRRLPIIKLDVIGIDSPFAEVHRLSVVSGLGGLKYTADIGAWTPCAETIRIEQALGR